MPDEGTWLLPWVGAAPAPLLAVTALLAGGVLGAVFFGGLWWTVQRAAASPRPVRWVVGSLVLRMAIVVPGMYFVSAGQPVRLGLCVLGFVLARVIVLHVARPRPAALARPPSGGSPCA